MILRPAFSLVCRLMAVLAASVLASSALAVTIGQVDDFEDGTAQNWGGSASHISNQPTGGPAGANDNYLQIGSTGTGGPGSRMVTLNTVQWTGDYAGITALSADVLNAGNNPLSLRLALGNSSGDWYASSTPLALTAGSGWTAALFPFSDLVSVSGTANLATVMAGVTEVRILSSAALPTIGNGGSPQGDRIAAELGLDNITAVPEPTAAVLLVAGTLAAWGVRRARRGCV